MSANACVFAMCKVCSACLHVLIGEHSSDVARYSVSITASFHGLSGNTHKGTQNLYEQRSFCPNTLLIPYGISKRRRRALHLDPQEPTQKDDVRELAHVKTGSKKTRIEGSDGLQSLETTSAMWQQLKL